MKEILIALLMASTVLAKPSANTNGRERAVNLIDSGFSASEQQAIVVTHNKYRQAVQPEAKQMDNLVWDERLAHLAKEWADECKTINDPDVHGQPGDKAAVLGVDDGFVGQNIFWGLADGVKAVDAWYSEIFFYDRCAPLAERCLPGKECGHYTQMIWAQTTKVGCGIANCKQSSGKLLPTVVCNYLPGGNIKQQHAYELKDVSGCGQCEPNFCGENGYATEYANTCKCQCRAGYTGNLCRDRDCQTPDDAMCRSYRLSPSSLYCDDTMPFEMGNGKKIRDVCLKACGKCKEAPTPAPCADKGFCEFYDSDECDEVIDNGKELKVSCPKLCNTCPGSCPPDDGYCKLYGLMPQHQYCDKTKAYQMANGKIIRDVCKHACNLC